jgi:hypothetical protein
MLRRIYEDTRNFHLTGYTDTRYPRVTGKPRESVTHTSRREERMGPMFDKELMQLRMREIEERVGHPRRPAARRRRRWWRRSG